MFYKRDVWNEELKEKIKKVIICSMESVKNMVTNRKNTHEIFGYDIMIDDDLNAWLIEVNSSPAMDYSTVKNIFLKKNLENNREISKRNV